MLPRKPYARDQATKSTCMDRRLRGTDRLHQRGQCGRTNDLGWGARPDRQSSA